MLIHQWRRDDWWYSHVGRNSWWRMKCDQHAAHNPKFEKIGLYRHPWWWDLKKIKGYIPGELDQYLLQWRHNERNGVSNARRLDCLLRRVFRRRSKEISKLGVTGLCAENSPMTGEFPAQRASNAENVSIWWRHRVNSSTSFVKTDFYLSVLWHAKKHKYIYFNRTKTITTRPNNKEPQIDIDWTSIRRESVGSMLNR